MANRTDPQWQHCRDFARLGAISTLAGWGRMTYRSALILTLSMVVLLVASIGETAIVAVSCASPGDLQAAVNAAAPFDVLNVSGTCTETFLTINSTKNGLTLDGGNMAIIQDLQVAASATAVTVTGASQVRIQHFGNITSNSTDGTGVFVVDGASVRILFNTIDGNLVGVQVSRNAQVFVNNNTITNNSDTGVLISETAAARIGFAFPVAAPNTIQNNGVGVVVTRGASARIIGNNISNNTTAGVRINRGSQADIASNTIANNGVNGIEVLRSSSVVLGNDTGTGPTNDPNSGTSTGFAVFCTLNSTVDGRLGTLSGTNKKKISASEGCVDSTIP